MLSDHSFHLRWLPKSSKNTIKSGAKPVSNRIIFFVMKGET